MSIIDSSLTCVFVKVFCYNLFTQTKNNTSPTPGDSKHDQSVILKDKYDSFLKTFPGETHGIVEYRTFVNNLKKIVINMKSIGKKFPQKNKNLLEVFSSENWHNLNDWKTLHKIFDCQACLKSWNNKMKVKQNGLIEPSILKDHNKRDIQQIKSRI